MRHDLDGGGVVDDAANASAYSNAFGTPSCANSSSCEGYELVKSLDFEDANGDGMQMISLSGQRTHT